MTTRNSPPQSVMVFQQHGLDALKEAESSGDEWSGKARGEPESLPAHSAQDEPVVSADEVCKDATSAISLKQQVEHHLDDIHTYKRYDLLKLCHMTF